MKGDVFMMYNSLSDGQKILVPLLCSLSFIFMYYKYKEDQIIPRCLLLSNFVLAAGCFILSIRECLKQLHYETLINKAIYPFMLSDISTCILVFGGVLVLRGCFLHPKYKEKKSILYMAIILLSILAVGYIVARFML